MKKKNAGMISKLTASALVFGTLFSPIGTNITKAEQHASQAPVNVQLLGMNDLHGQIDTSRTVSGKKAGTAATLAAYLKQREATNPDNTFKVLAGDTVGASSPTSALFQDEPTIKVLNKLGFDVGGLGNHEFDEGVAELKRLLDGGSHPKTVEKYGPFEGANFPYVAANVIDEKTNETLLDPYVIKEADGVKIGFIGVVLSDTPSVVTPSGVEGVKFTDETAAINKYAAELKAKGVETIVVLAHNGGTSKPDGTEAVGEAADIANQVDDEVDVIVGGHSHSFMNATVDGKLVVQSYSYGTAFSDIDLTIDPATGDVIDKKAEIVTTFQDGITPDPEIAALVQGYKDDVAPIINEVVGKTDKEITRTQNEHGESVLGNIIADSMRAAMPADFALMNPGGIRADVDAGDITWGELFTVQPFGNDLVKLTFTGQQFKEVLNQQWQVNNKLQISGFKYTWNPDKAVGDKVVDILLPNGEKIDLNKEYTVVTNNFLADGGDGFTTLKAGKGKVVGPTDLDAFVNYVKAQKDGVKAAIEGRIISDTNAGNNPIVNPIGNKDTVLTGKTKPGAKVIVEIGGKTTEGTADKDGNFTIVLKRQPVGTVITVKIEGQNPITVTVIDNTAPVVSKVRPVSNLDNKIKGKADPYSEITIKDKAGAIIATATADEDGKFAAKLLKPLTAGIELFVTATDEAGNVSKVQKVIVIDRIAPAKPVVNQVKDYDKKVTGKAEAGSSVIVYAGKAVLGTAVADKNGNFSVSLKSVQKASTVLTVKAADKAKNVSAAANVTVVDKTAPKSPSVNKVTHHSSYVTGKAEAGATVYVKAGSKQIGYAAVNSKGTYSVKIKQQKAGTVLTVYVKDKAGNVSKSYTIKVSK